MLITIPKNDKILNDKRNYKIKDLIDDLASLNYFETPDNPYESIYVDGFINKFKILLMSDSPTFFDDIFIIDLISTYDLKNNMDNVIDCSILLMQKAYTLYNDLTLEPQEPTLITTINFKIFIEKENERPYAEASAYLITQAVWNVFSQKNGRKGC